ncbi:MAG: polyprenyl synthetase family protein, partial [Muribaculaceae bacterium]|nr:polyprenyl synthetase family protein [Muribaculaceae bacterium]
AFQIKDDIFDYFIDTAVGKPTGNDLSDGKLTLPLIPALTSSHPKAAQMAELSRRDVLSTDEINQLIEFAKEAGGIEYAYATMERLRNESMQYLDMSNPVSKDFIKLFDYIIERTY